MAQEPISDDFGKEPTAKDYPELLTMAEAAEMLGVSRSWLSRHVRFHEDEGITVVCQESEARKCRAALRKAQAPQRAAARKAARAAAASAKQDHPLPLPAPLSEAERRAESRCGAPTRNGTPCDLPKVTETTGRTYGRDKGSYTNFKRCWQHQDVHPNVKCSPLSQAPKPKRSNWTPAMRAAASERSWQANRDRQERRYQELMERAKTTEPGE